MLIELWGTEFNRRTDLFCGLGRFNRGLALIGFRTTGAWDLTDCCLIKVAEHSFSARLCWCKLARAQGFQKTNMPWTERSFYLLNTRTICVIFLYNCMQCIDGFSTLLQRYVTKGYDAKNAAFLAFVCYRKNPFSSLEPTIVLACGRNQELWE